MIFEVTATINVPEIPRGFEQKYTATSLDTIWRAIQRDHSTVTSVVLVFTKPKLE